MKTKYIIKSILVFTLMISVFSCSEEHLDVKPEGLFVTEAYYSNQDEAFGALVSVYDVMRKEMSGWEHTISALNVLSDDHVAGGGSGGGDRPEMQVFSNYNLTAVTIPGSHWSDHYQGIYRANILISKLPEIPMEDALKSRYAAEAKTLRAYYYFKLVTMFKNIPLIVEPLPQSEWYSILQADPSEVYAQIELDLNEAMAVLPATIDLATEAGRVTKGTAQALLGKVLRYQGKNAQAATQLAEVNGTPGGTSQYGYRLLDNFSDLWGIDNKFNSESIFEAATTNVSQHGWDKFGGGEDEGNIMNTMYGPRDYKQLTSNAPDILESWGFCLVLPALYDAMQGDPRLEATILDMAALEASGDASYEPSHLNTGYFMNKFINRASYQSELGGDYRLNYRQNVYVIRLADTYLMEAEALGASGARAQALFDAVRARVGLPSVPVSMDAIMLERRKELAGEGHRFFDLVRTGRAQSNADLLARGFEPGKSETFPIPFGDLSNTMMVQNPNY
jgi:hypothetical protein